MNITEANAVAVLLEALGGQPVDRFDLAVAINLTSGRVRAALAAGPYYDGVQADEIAREHGCPRPGDLVRVGNGTKVWRVRAIERWGEPELIELDPIEGYTTSSVPLADWRRLHLVEEGS